MNKLLQVFGSHTKVQEILLLQHNLKNVVRHGFYESELPSVIKFCEKQNLHYVKSKFKVLLAEDTAYSNKGIRILEKDKRPGMYFIYISKNEEKSLLAAYYELVENHEELGKLLGYPSCCIDYFTKNFTSENPNPIHQPTNAWTNITRRDQDLVLLSHFPCSSECKESIILAKKYLAMIYDLDKERAEELLNRLKIQDNKEI
ncbi:MAG: DUF483 domain-containing protein [archaeon]|nr:DUF483 domain-containing protein [archaeon]